MQSKRTKPGSRFSAAIYLYLTNAGTAVWVDSLESVSECRAEGVAKRPRIACMGSPGAYRGILGSALVPPSASATASMTASQPAHTVTVKGPHGQGMEWSLDS